jgi:hypothetical protein
VTHDERMLILDLCALLEAYMNGRVNWDGSTTTQAKVAIKQAEALLYPTSREAKS